MQSKTLKWLSFGSLAVLIVLMAAATVIERLHGTEVALTRIYHHPVFFALWGLTAVSGLWLLWRRGTFRKPFTLGLHLALVLILAGALITHLTGRSGEIHLRNGVETARFTDDDGQEGTLPFSLELKEFRIEYDPGTRNVSDYVSELVCEGRPVTI